MALVVEDGTGLSTANAYVSLVFVDAYHVDRNHTAWVDFITQEREAAVVRATDYIDKRFGRRFVGFRSRGTQALEWPRLDALDDDGYLLSNVPFQVEKACAEYAMRAILLGVLAPDPVSPVPDQSLESGETARTSDKITGEVIRKKEVVGPLEEETWFESGSRNMQRYPSGGARSLQSSMLNDFHIPEYPEADLWIETLLGSSTVTLARA